MLEVAIATVGLVAVFVLPVRVVALAFGVLLPIDFVQFIDPLYFDAARYGLAVILALRLRRTSSEPTHRGWAVSSALMIGLVGLVAAIKGYGEEGSLFTTGVTMLLSVAVSYQIARRTQVHSRILLGFVVGNLLSSIDIIFQYVGLPYIGMPSEWGDRYSGFSHISTTAAPLLAVSILIVIGMMERLREAPARHPMLLITSGLAVGTLMLALVLTNGRGGLVGLFAGILLLVVRGLRDGRASAFVAILVAIAAGFNYRTTITGYFVRDGRTDLSSGRVERNADALAAFLREPLLGPDARVIQGLNPHTPILSFGLFAGLAGVIIALLLMWRLVRLAWEGIWAESTASVLLGMVSAVILVASLLEPDGFFVGLAPLVILLIVFSAGPDVGRAPGGISGGEGRHRDPVAGASMRLEANFGGAAGNRLGIVGAASARQVNGAT